MATTIESLKEKLARVQQELAEVSAALDELAAAPGTAAGAPQNDTTRIVLRGPKFADPEALLPLIDAAYAKMGIDTTQPAPTAEEVQELMRREGVRPEDNILSRGIIEAREE